MSAPTPLREAMDWTVDLASYLPFGLRRAGLQHAGPGDDPQKARRADELLAALHPRRMKLRLREAIDETPSTKTLRFERVDGPLPPFLPGQYVNLFVEVAGVRTSRPYSISSAPGLPHLDLTVRAGPGGFVGPALLAAKPGAHFESTGPTGCFHHEPLGDGKNLVFLAGGSGITPFMSILRDQARRGWTLSVDLLYGSRTPDDVIFGAELEKLAAASDRLRYTLVVSEPPKGYKGAKGLLDAKLLRKKVPQLEGRTFYVCGPRAMYDLCLAELAALGVPPHRIRTEPYGPPPDITQAAGWPAGVDQNSVFRVRVEDGKELEARATEPLMVSLERAGVVVPAVCRTGACSACRMRVVSGPVFHAPVEGLRASDRKHGYAHACATYPLGDLVVRL